MENLQRDINKERDALKQVTTDKAFLNKVGIRAGTDLTALKTTNPDAYKSLFEEVNRRAYKTPDMPDIDVQTPTQPQTTLDKAVERSELLRKAGERVASETAPAQTPSQELKSRIPTIQKETGLTESRKKFAELQAGFITAPREIKEKLQKEKGFDIDKITEEVGRLNVNLSTARGRFLEGDITATDFAKMASDFYHASRSQKHMLRQLTDEVDKGVEYYKSLISMSQNELKNAQDDYADALDLEGAGLKEASDLKQQAINNLIKTYEDLKKDEADSEKAKKKEKADFQKAQGYVIDPKTGELVKTLERERFEKPTGGGGTTPTYKVSTADRGELLATGLNSEQIDNIIAGIDEYGIDVVMEAEDLTPEQEQGFRNVLSGVTEAQEAKQTKFIDEKYIRSYFDEDELKSAAKESGFTKGGGFLGIGVGEEGISDYIKWLLNRVENQRKANINDEKIWKDLFG